MTEKTSLTPLVELKSLSKGFDGKQIISRLDLTINHGEFLTILALQAVVRRRYYV